MKKTGQHSQFAGDPNHKILLARLLDKSRVSQERDIPAHSSFLSPEEQAMARQQLSRLPQDSYLFTGGYEGAERCICAFLPSWMDETMFFDQEEGPLCALEVLVPPMAKLGHRDYLGSLMGLGITREKIGDILLKEKGCQLVLLRETLGILMDQWSSAGRYPLTLTPIPLAQLESRTPELRKIRDTVASLRLDGVLAAGFSLSRGKAGEYIGAKRVLVNHLPCEKTDKMLTQGDVITCRGLGKCVLQSVLGNSKKGRIIIELDRYE